MNLNSARDVAQWVLSTPAFGQNRTIVTHMTGAMPSILAETVRAFDREGYIKAFWKREENGNGRDLWRWCLHRTKRRIEPARAAVIVQQASWEATNRKAFSNDD